MPKKFLAYLAIKTLGRWSTYCYKRYIETCRTLVKILKNVIPTFCCSKILYKLLFQLSGGEHILYREYAYSAFVGMESSQ